MKNSKFKIQNSKLIPIVTALLTITLSTAQPTRAQVSSGGVFSLTKSVIAAGGGESAGAGFTVAGTAGQNTAGAASQTGGFSLIGGFWTPEQFAPTAAMVSIGGKVTTFDGNGIRNVVVTLTDAAGNVRTTVTGSFGFYRLTDVAVGQTYILQVQAKKYFFSNPSQVVSVSDELINLDFTAED